MSTGIVRVVEACWCISRAPFCAGRYKGEASIYDLYSDFPFPSNLCVLLMKVKVAWCVIRLKEKVSLPAVLGDIWSLGE